jgi:2-polyprenyl-3-methyl-5-hydroxy-6-metoxy-1,4-benzoquinol methylase
VSADVLSFSSSPSAAYRNKAPAYFSGARVDFVRRLPQDATASILEVGCGTGATGALALASGRAARYTGIELFETAAADARKVLTSVITGDVERLDLNFGPTDFDALIFSEVLEHLVEPQRTVKKLVRALRPGGLVLASSPNIAHWRVVRELIEGRFNLADQGVFDRTHMRWFTPSTFAAMFEEAGLRVESLGPVTPFSQRTELISRLTRGRYDHLFMTQIQIAARKI